MSIQKWLFTFAWLGVLSLAIFLRIHDLADRPIHADEATGARILAQQLEDQEYSYNPRHFHGPTLSQIAYPLARLRGENDWASLSVTTLRISTAIGGVLLVLTPLLWLRSIGTWATLLAGAWLATSPLLVYYSRVYIHETWLTLFGMLACAGLYRLTLRPNTGTALTTGIVLGLMFATKITVAISLLSWLIAIAGLFVLLRHSGSTIQGFASLASRAVYLKALVYLVLGGVICSFVLYSNYLRSPMGFLDALRSFFIYQPTLGHEKPFYDYAARLIWPKPLAGLWWTEIVVLLCAVAAVVFSRSHPQPRMTTCFLALAGLAHLLIYSSIGYKTPWLMLLPWAHVCLLAGCLLVRPPPTQQGIRFAILLLILAGLGYQTKQSCAATGQLENHPKNPYVYVPTSRNVAALADWLDSLNALQPLETIAVVGREYWPLPWYLKRLDVGIHYWPDAKAAELNSYPVVLSMPTEQFAVRQQLRDTHIEHPRSLRSNVPLFMFLDDAIWNLWIEKNDDGKDL